MEEAGPTSQSRRNRALTCVFTQPKIFPYSFFAVPKQLTMTSTHTTSMKRVLREFRYGGRRYQPAAPHHSGEVKCALSEDVPPMVAKTLLYYHTTGFRLITIPQLMMP